jgi:glycosyltransferase involved in cell wall biosynthesis
MDVVVSPVQPPQATPRISVLVPARNMARCLDRLLSQTYPNFELIVLDDRSSDTMPAILQSYAARDKRLTVLTGVELPPG